MRLRWLAPAPVIVVGALFATEAARSSYRAQQDVIAGAEDDSLRRVATILDRTTTAEADRATALAEVLATRRVLRDALRAGDRAGLLEASRSTYEVLHARYGVQGIQFVVPPGTSFLRLHAPDQFGDDLTDRRMITRTLADGEAQHGVEVGSTGAKVRGAVRMADDAGPVGVVEVQIGFEPVLARVKDLTGYEVAAYLRQEGAPPPDARMVDGYRELATTDRAAVTAVVDPGAMDGVKDAVFSRAAVDGERFGVLYAPLLDFEGSRIGVVVATRSFAAFQTQERAALRRSMVVLLLQLIAVAATAVVTFNGLVLRPVQRLAARLDAGEGPDAELAARQDEVGDLARAVSRSAGRTE